jgi:hypothetical protein
MKYYDELFRHTKNSKNKWTDSKALLNQKAILIVIHSYLQQILYFQMLLVCFFFLASQMNKSDHNPTYERWGCTDEGPLNHRFRKSRDCDWEEHQLGKNSKAGSKDDFAIRSWNKLQTQRFRQAISTEFRPISRQQTDSIYIVIR